jgi:peptide/nickel transport system permease protein
MTDTVKQEVAQPLPRGWKASDSPVKRAFAKSRLVQAACGTLLLIVLATIFAPLLAWQNPFDPANLDLMDAFTAPWSQGMGEAFYPLGRTTRAAMCSAPFCMACACRSLWACPPWRCR